MTNANDARHITETAAVQWQAILSPDTLPYGQPFNSDDVKFNVHDKVVFWETSEDDAMPVFGFVVAVHAASYDIDIPDNHIPANWQTVNIPARDVYAA